MSDRAKRAPRPLAVLVRTAAVLTLLAGVLAMHALTAHHGPPPATWAPAATAALYADPVMGVSHEHASTGSVAGAHGPTVAHTVAGPVNAEGCADCGSHPGPAHTGAHLLDVCLGVLFAATISLLLVMVACARRPARTAPIRRTPRLVRQVSSALRPPSLSMLCVLRT